MKKKEISFINRAKTYTISFYSFSILHHLVLVILCSLPMHVWGGLPCFEVQGSLLYLAPSYDETYFVINGSGLDGAGNPTPSGKRNNNPVGYNLGFRLEGMYLFCPCVDFRLRWTHIFAKSTETVSNRDIPFQLWPTEISPNQNNVSQPFSGSAFSHIGVMYQKGESLFEERLYDCAGWHFTLREGIEWSYIRYQEDIEYEETSGTFEKIRFHGHTKGLGPQLGMIVLCAPGEIFSWYPRNWSFKFMTTASLIAANSKAKISSIDTLGAQNKVTQTSFWRFVPEWNLTFGINYLCNIWSCRTNIELGYEITTYVRGVSKLIFDSTTNPGRSFNQYSDFYVHGLYLALALFF